MKQYVSRWLPLRNLRDVAQHADRDYTYKLYAGNYVYGSLYWLDYSRKSTDGTITAVTRHAGPEANYGQFDEPFPTAIDINGDGGIDAVVLRAGGHEVNLTQLLTDSIKTVGELDVIATSAALEHNARVVAERPEQADHINDRLKVDWTFQVLIGPFVRDDEPSDK